MAKARSSLAVTAVIRTNQLLVSLLYSQISFGVNVEQILFW